MDIRKRGILARAAALLASKAEAQCAQPQIATVVKGPGIDPTGSADSTTAIQTILTAASGGLPVFFPPGTYKISATLTIGSDVTLWGSGRGITIIKGASMTVPLLQSTNTATRYYNWHIKDLGFDNTSRAVAGSVGIDMTNISHSRVDFVNSNNVNLGLKLNEAAYYSQFSTFQVNGAVTGIKVGPGAVSTNECLFNNLRINDVVNGVIIDNSTNMTFIKAAIELFTGIAFDIAPSTAVQYVNLICCRSEPGGAALALRNRALAQATTWLAGATVGGSEYINDAPASQLLWLRPGELSPWHAW